MRKILVIDCHPDPESYCASLADSYIEAAKTAGHEVESICIRDLEFNPNLEFGYRKRTELEPDLLESQNLIKNAEHLIWIFPVWWGSLPAISKGFIDRVFLPGFAFQKRDGSLLWDKLLKGKSARLISTMDQPSWFYRLVYGRPKFTGVKKVKSTSIGPIRESSDQFRENWLHKVAALGSEAK